MFHVEHFCDSNPYSMTPGFCLKMGRRRMPGRQVPASQITQFRAINLYLYVKPFGARFAPRKYPRKATKLSAFLGPCRRANSTSGIIAFRRGEMAEWLKAAVC